MAEMWKPQDISVYRGWIAAITDEASDKLNDWETNFIASLDERLTLGRNLTEYQAEKLEEVYVKHTS